jgi:hypothetical protein
MVFSLCKLPFCYLTHTIWSLGVQDTVLFTMNRKVLNTTKLEKSVCTREIGEILLNL